jgi:hypothetical protein
MASPIDGFAAKEWHARMDGAIDSLAEVLYIYPVTGVCSIAMNDQ